MGVRKQLPFRVTTTYIYYLLFSLHNIHPIKLLLLTVGDCTIIIQRLGLVNNTLDL